MIIDTWISKLASCSYKSANEYTRCAVMLTFCCLAAGERREPKLSANRTVDGKTEALVEIVHL